MPLACVIRKASEDREDRSHLGEGPKPSKHVEQIEQDDDRQRDADRPKQNSAHGPSGVTVFSASTDGTGRGSRLPFVLRHSATRNKMGS